MLSGAEQKQKSIRKWIRLIWLAAILGCLAIVLLITALRFEWIGTLPDITTLENPKSNLASQVFSDDGEVLGRYFRENRVNISYDKLGPYITKALVATEDERFYQHCGIDFKGVVRAVAYRGKKGGASTLTQQLAKMLFHERSSSFIKRVLQKLQEWIISIQLEKRYTKEEIIMMYLNQFDFINNAVGIKTAAGVYFNTTPDSLRIEQAAMLVGMCKNPSLFNPNRRPDTTLHRREVVLFQMKKNGFITQTEYDSLRTLPLGLDYHVVDHKAGLAPYFREILRGKLAKLLSEKDEDGEYIISKPDGSAYDMYSDGLRIYTTINAKLQTYAEWAVAQHLGTELQKAFWKNLKHKRNAPFDWRVSKKQVQEIIESAIKRTQKYAVLTGKECGNCHRRGKYISKKVIDGVACYVCSAEECADWKQVIPPEDSVMAWFYKPHKMTVFSWHGEIDTVMTPVDSIKYYKSILQTGFMAMDPHTGYIKAWVGGINFKHFSYDHVIQSRRQVGSTFKPFVYTIPMMDLKNIRHPPCYMVPNARVVFNKDKWHTQNDWSPKNADGDYGGMMTLKCGMANSINTITSWVMKQYGPEPVIDLVRKLGMTSPLDPVPSLALGVADLSLYEMIGAYGTYANKGRHIEPSFITRIEDKNGNVIFTMKPKSNEAISEKTAWVMLQMMKAVTDGAWDFREGHHKKTGTGMRIRFKSRPYGGHTYPIAAKTGTTQSNSDGWYMGMTPDLVAGCWVGAEDRSVRFSQTALGQGANMALPIWGYFMQKVHNDPSIKISTGDFEKPANMDDVPECDCKKYMKTHENATFDPNNVQFSNQ